MTPEEALLELKQTTIDDKMKLKTTEDGQYCIERRIKKLMDRPDFAGLVGIAMSHSGSDVYFGKKESPNGEPVEILKIIDGRVKDPIAVAHIKPVPEGNYIVIKTNDVYIAATYIRELEESKII